MQFVILSYVSRSGSTLLSRLINEEVPNVIVMPEFQLPQILVATGEAQIKNMSSKDLIQITDLDYQSKNLDINQTDLVDIVRENNKKGIHAILSSIVNRYGKSIGKENCSIAVLKSGSLVHISDSILKTLGSCSIIHIFRDPRGVINSQIKNYRPYFPGEKMARGDPYYAAKKWSKYLTKIDQLKINKYKVHELKYESLIVNTEYELARLTSFLEPSHLVTGTQNYGVTFKLSGPESSLHRLVQNNPLPYRTDAWKTEMDMISGYTVEVVARKEMIDKSYDVYFAPQLSVPGRIKVISFALLKYIALLQASIIRRICLYSTRPQLLKNRLLFELRRIFDK